MFMLSPVDDQNGCEINLGLLLQYRFVDLDKHSVSVYENVTAPLSSVPICNPSQLTPPSGDSCSKLMSSVTNWIVMEENCCIESIQIYQVEELRML